MTKVREIRRLLSQCTAKQRRQVFDELRQSVELHPFETSINAKAEIILEALHRAPELTTRMFRGILGEATFAVTVAPAIIGWKDETPPGNHAYDTALVDSIGIVRIQSKMQRRTKGQPLIRNGKGIVEVQRTRTGMKAGKATRPYRYGEFDVLAVCMEPSHGRWDSFMYIPERWLLPRKQDRKLIEILQTISLEPDDVWTDNFDTAVVRFRAGARRPK
jgi:hypothetical protein